MLSDSLPRRSKGIFYGWWIVLAGFIIQMFSGCLLFHGFGTYVLPLQAEFAWSRAQVSGAFSVVQAESGLLGPLQGWLIDRYGPRAVMRVGFVVFGLGFVLFSRMDSLFTFYFSFAIIALGWSLAGFMPVATTIAHWFWRWRSTALGIMLVGMGTGGLLVPVMVWSLSIYGWRTTAQASGLLIILLGLPLSQLMRHRPEDYGYRPDGAVGGRVDEKGRKEQEVEPSFTTRQALRTSAFWFLALGHGLALVVVGVVLVHQIPHMVEGMGLSTEMAAANVAVMVGMTMAGQLVGGYLGDRFDKRLIMFACMWLHGGGLLVFAYADSVAAARLFAVLHGTAWGVRGTLVNTIRADYFGRASYGTVSGFASLITMVGMTLGPLFAGFVHDWTGSYQTAFLVIAVLVALGSGAFLLARKPELPNVGAVTS